MAPLDPNLASEPPASSETCRTRERRDHGSTCEQPGPDVGCWTLSLVRRTGSSNVAIILERSHSRYTHRGTLEHAGLSEAARRTRVWVSPATHEPSSASVVPYMINPCPPRAPVAYVRSSTGSRHLPTQESPSTLDQSEKAAL